MDCFRLNRFFSSSAIVAGLLFGAVAYFAATPGFAEPAEQACAPDVMRLCRQFVPDHARIAACLWRNSRHLSPACHIVMLHAKRKRHASR
jgi:hypothetical protein